jgi:hypothetical protein
MSSGRGDLPPALRTLLGRLERLEVTPDEVAVDVVVKGEVIHDSWGPVEDEDGWAFLCPLEDLLGATGFCPQCRWGDPRVALLRERAVLTSTVSRLSAWEAASVALECGNWELGTSTCEAFWEGSAPSLVWRRALERLDQARESFGEDVRLAGAGVVARLLGAAPGSGAAPWVLVAGRSGQPSRLEAEVLRSFTVGSGVFMLPGDAQAALERSGALRVLDEVLLEEALEDEVLESVGTLFEPGPGALGTLTGALEVARALA